MKRIIKTFFLAPTNNVWLQLFRYGFVGGIAFIVDYVSLYTLTEFAGLYHLVSAAIAFVLGLFVNYMLSTSWVFDKRGKSSNKFAEFAVFAVIGIIGLGLNEVIIYLCTDILNIHYLLSKLISTAIVFFWNFFARKFLLFSKPVANN